MSRIWRMALVKIEVAADGVCDPLLPVPENLIPISAAKALSMPDPEGYATFISGRVPWKHRHYFEGWVAAVYPS